MEPGGGRCPDPWNHRRASHRPVPGGETDPLCHGSSLPGGTPRDPHGQPGGMGVLEGAKILGSPLLGTPHGPGSGRGRRGRDSEP